MILILLFSEVALLLAGFALGQPFLGAAAAAALVYFILAYRFPNVAWIMVWLAFPFSIEVVIPGGNALHVPTEPMIAVAMLAWLIRLPATRPIRVPWTSLHTPLAALGGITLLSAALGTYPWLGVKGMIAATGYILFAYIYCLINCRDPSTIERSVPWIVGSAAVWGLYGVLRIASQGFTLASAYGAARPFFTEHGSYAAYLAMIQPVAILWAMETRGRARLLYAAASLAISLGIGLSLTRAAWVSLLIVLPPTLGLWFLWRRRIKPLVQVAAISGAVLVILLSFGAGARISRHAETITESGDVSNLERFNRWMAAIEMVRDRPVLGVGYAAFPRVYTQYRRKLILTDMAYVHSGAHSEIFRLLAESGILGFLAASWLLGATAFLGLRIFRRSSDPRARLIALATLAALGTYVVHGFFRTYIDLEKVAVPFWASLGLLGALGQEFASSAKHAVNRATRA